MLKCKWLFVIVRESKHPINNETYVLLKLIPGQIFKDWHECVEKTSHIIMPLLYQIRTKAQRGTWTRHLSTLCSASALATSLMADLFSATSPEMLLIYAGRKFADDYFLPWSTYPVSLSIAMNNNFGYTCTARFIPTYLTNFHSLRLRLFNYTLYKCLWLYTVRGDSWVFNNAVSTLETSL
jgi:hypothetical protein